MYQGPIIDTFLHGPWIGALSSTRADRVEWIGDRRLRRVMQTFRHDGHDGDGFAYLDVPAMLHAMDASGVTRGILATKVYYPATADAVVALNRDFAAMSAASDGRLKWIASAIPPELGASSYWDVMQNTRLIDAISDDPGLCGIHITTSP